MAIIVDNIPEEPEQGHVQCIPIVDYNTDTDSTISYTVTPCEEGDYTPMFEQIPVEVIPFRLVAASFINNECARVGESNSYAAVPAILVNGYKMIGDEIVGNVDDELTVNIKQFTL